MDTTNLRQIEGGTVIKQADRSSVLSFILQDAKGREVKLDGQSAQVALYTNQGKFWETTTKVKGAEVSFSLPGNLAVDDYLLDISVAGYVFPSDRDLIIRVTQGFKNLPDKETAERAKQTLEEITADVQKQADEKLNQNITIITKKKDEFTSHVDTKATEVSTTGDKYLKDIEATTSQNISDIRQISKTEADKITASSTEAISLIGHKKDQALKEIDSKANTIADTVKADVEGLLKDKVDKEPGKGLSDNNFSGAYKAKLDNLDKDIDKKLGLTVTRFEKFLKETTGSLFMEDALENWRKIPSGYYYVRPNNIENQPSGYGFMRVINYQGDFSVIWETMRTGPIYRKSGNDITMDSWLEIFGGGIANSIVYTNLNYMKDVKVTTEMNGNNTVQKIDDKYIIRLTDPGHHSSVMINSENFIEDEIFILSFFAKKIDGNVTNIGGHSLSYTTHEVYLDGKKQNVRNWHVGCDYPNDNKTHFLQAVLSLNKSDKPDRNLYIQVNRRDSFRELCDIEISNIEILNLKDKYEISNHFNGQSHIGYLRDNAILGSENIIDYNWRAL